MGFFKTVRKLAISLKRVLALFRKQDMAKQQSLEAVMGRKESSASSNSKKVARVEDSDESDTGQSPPGRLGRRVK